MAGCERDAARGLYCGHGRTFSKGHRPRGDSAGSVGCVRTELAAMARAIEPGRFFGNRPADDVECEREHRVAASLAGLGTSSPIVWGDRVIVTSQIGTSVVAAGAAASAAGPGRPRARRARDSDWRHAAAESEGASSDVWLVVEAFSRSDGKRLWEPSDQGDRRPARGPRKAQPCHADAGHRRRAHLRLVRQWPDRGARHGGAPGLDAASRCRDRAVPDTVGARELTGAVWRPPDPAVRPPLGRLPAGGRCADREGSVEGGSARRRAPRTARRWSCAGPEGAELLDQLDRSASTLRSRDWKAVVVRRRTAADADSLGGLPRRPDLSEPRLPEQ